MDSIDYAVQHFGINLIVVVGHQFCGVVGEAMKEPTSSLGIESIRESYLPVIEKCKNENHLHSTV